MFGAELRALRQRRGMSLAGLGELVHVSGDLLGKIEKAVRRPQPDLVARLDAVLDADGLLIRRAEELHDDLPHAGAQPTVAVEPEQAEDTLRALIDCVRMGDHAMSASAHIGALIAHARAAEQAIGRLSRPTREAVASMIGESYQLAGWMAFDGGRPERAEHLLGLARSWAERAGDTALAAYILGPNLSFIATYGGQPALGVERAYGALGWARRSGNHRLVAFTLAIGARAHARLGETTLCLSVLDQSRSELHRHTLDDDHDRGWLSVFDHAALDGHRGSCLLDLGEPDRALEPLARQRDTAPRSFVRNGVIWQLDQVDALLQLNDLNHAAAALRTAAAMPVGEMITPRVRRRFRAVELTLDTLPDDPAVAEARDACRAVTAVTA